MLAQTNQCKLPATRTRPGFSSRLLPAAAVRLGSLRASHLSRPGASIGRAQRQISRASPADTASAPSPAASPTSAAATADSTDLTDSQAHLNEFLQWLVNNGVQGIGLDDSAVGLYEGEDGERGLMALRDISQGEAVLRVPLRLALTDHREDTESNQLLYEDAPWSVRLSAKLLRERGRGAQSPWYPYIRVLPKSVPAPLETFSWEDMQQIEWAPMQAAIYDYNWLVTDAWNRSAGALSQPAEDTLRAVEAELAAAEGSDSSAPQSTSAPSPTPTPTPDTHTAQRVLGGATQEDFQWAMAVVHSRTFANAARGGGVGVRMLVPLVDMLNHAGDVTVSGRMDDKEVKPADNVRWDLVGPQRSPSGAWEMVVSATQPIPTHTHLTLSYGERPSDEFFLHYGFVPPLCNPHEAAVLFEDAEEALEWHYAQYASEMSEADAERVYTAAYTNTVTEQRQAATPAPTPPTQPNTTDTPTQTPAAAPQASQPSQEAGAVASTPAQATGTSQQPPVKLPKGWQDLKVYAAGRVDNALVTGFATASGGNIRAAELAVARRAQELLRGMRTPLLLDLWLLHQDARSRNDAAETQVLRTLLWQQLEQQTQVEAAQGSEQAEAWSCPKDSKSVDELVEKLGREYGTWATGVPGALPTQVTPQQRLSVRYRIGKKIVLWGVVHRALCGAQGQGAAKDGAAAAGSAGASQLTGQDLLANLPRRNQLS